MMAIPEARRAHYHWVDATVGGILISGGIICPVVSDSAFTWFNRYIYS